MDKTMADNGELLIQKVKIPFKIAKRGKHKPHIIKPNNSVDEKIMDDALVQALGKAKLWENELITISRFRYRNCIADTQIMHGLFWVFCNGKWYNVRRCRPRRILPQKTPNAEVRH
jgi:hypothetical protein